MKCYLKNNKEKFKLVLYCFVLSFVILSITSKCSFLYPFNDWVDANAFFTIGKGMAHGLVPFKDIFEQKGILLYFIYMIGYLFSNTTFHGVFILEVLFWTFTLYYAYKTIRFFLSKRSASIILPVFMMLLCTSSSFVHGGSAEEFSMPFLMLTMYYFIKSFKEKELSNKEFIISGLCAGCVLLIKYTLLGFWFGFMAFFFFYFLKEKKTKKAFMSCIYFLIGMIFPFLISLIYFGINHSIKEYFDVYFLTNINAYTREVPNILVKIYKLCKGFGATVLKNGPIITILLLGFIPLLFKLKIKKDARVGLIVIYVFAILGMYFGLRFYRYYLFPMLIFALISLVIIFSYFDKKIEIISNKIYYVIISISLVVCVALSYFFANYRSMIGTKKEDMFQYKFSEIINKEENPTLLNMGYLDCGVYTMSGIVPNTYFFEVHNIPYEKFPDNLDQLKDSVKNKKVMFVIYFTESNIERVTENEKELIENYELIASARQKFQNTKYNAFLFKVKN